MMSLIDTPVGHATLTLADLDPKRSPAFSPNLYKYLKKEGHFYREGGIAQGAFRILPDTEMAKEYGAGTLMLGFIDNEFMIGTRMTTALCYGGKAECYAYPIVRDLDPVEGFWDKYLQIGRCAIDDKHIHDFMSERFKMDDDVRTCHWCGHQQRKMNAVRIVSDEYWIEI